MPVLAQFDDLAQAGERRATPRRRLRLLAKGADASAPDAQVVVHDLSRTGLLIETPSSLDMEANFEVELPEAGTVEAMVIWNSGCFFGCRFEKPISRAVLSAAMLQSPAPLLRKIGARPSASEALAELKVLSERVRQASAAIDDIIDELREPVPRTVQARQLVRDKLTLEEQEERDPTSFVKGLGIALVLAAAAWAFIFWALGAF